MARVAMTLALAVFAGTLTCAGSVLNIGYARAQSSGTPEDQATRDQTTRESAPPKKKSQAKRAKQDSDGKAAASGEQKTPRDAAAVQKTLETAQKSLEAGKADVAATQVTTLIADGGLDSRSMARALSIRGQAYRKQGKPAQAIAELQSALWLRGGLNEAERAAAIQARADAYREAGLGDAPAIGGNKGSPEPNRAAGIPTSPQAANTSIATATAAPRPAPAPVPAPAASPGQQPTGSGNGVGQFFSNLFGGGGKSQPAPVAAPVAAPADPASSSWSSATTSAIAEPTPGAKGAKTAATKTASAAGAAGTGKAKAGAGQFRLQLAAMRSRDEAQAAAERVKQEYGRQIGELPYEINEAVFGNMGTFYRARFGPYAGSAEPQAVCAALRGKGTDCMIISN